MGIKMKHLIDKLGREKALTKTEWITLLNGRTPDLAEYLFAKARDIRHRHYGRDIYIRGLIEFTNYCRNNCYYCGIRRGNEGLKRYRLTEEEIINEYKAIKRLAPFENLLLVTGENPAAAGVPYIAHALDLAKPYFSNLQIEVMPLKAEEYKELTHHGLNGVICFQETYNKANYKKYHPRGMKSKFEWRVDGFDRP